MKRERAMFMLIENRPTTAAAAAAEEIGNLGGTHQFWPESVTSNPA